MDNNMHQFQGQSSKFKVTRQTNAEIGSASYIPNGKGYELQTQYTDGVRRPYGAGNKKVTYNTWRIREHTIHGAITKLL